MSGGQSDIRLSQPFERNVGWIQDAEVSHRSVSALLDMVVEYWDALYYLLQGNRTKQYGLRFETKAGEIFDVALHSSGLTVLHRRCF